jgi:hypothetical protein
LPWGAELLWEWFWELRWASGSSGPGARPISHGEIKAWAELQGLELNPWEVHTLRAMDQTFLNFLAAARPRRKGA